MSKKRRVKTHHYFLFISASLALGLGLITYFNAPADISAGGPSLTKGKPGGGSTGPVISSVVATNLTFASAAITFTTDTPSSNSACYSTEKNLRTYTCYYGEGSTSHQVLLDYLNPNTLYYFRAKAQANGVTSESTIQSFKTLPAPAVSDVTPPTRAITSHVNNDVVNGTIHVTASAEDANGVTQVVFSLDDRQLGRDIIPPYSYPINTNNYPDGFHNIKIIAIDPAGNGTWTSPVRVQFLNSPPDTTPPTVSLTSPLNGATISGYAPMNASASDNVGVAQVQFRVGGLLMAVDTTAPYSFNWYTPNVANGSYVLTATARDAAFNYATSTAITVIVNNVSTSTPTTTPQ